jgi:AraC-like DNA-binding protein
MLRFPSGSSVCRRRLSGTLNRVSHGRFRTKAVDRFGLIRCTSHAPLRVRQRNRESVINRGEMVLISTHEAGEFTSAGTYSSWTLVEMPKTAILLGVPGAENLVATALRTDGETSRMIAGYTRLVMQQNITDPLLEDHVSQTIADLAALFLGAEKQAAELARHRGLKSARLDAILRQIADHFADPDFSVSATAARLRLSVRYVQDVLHATGVGFTDRVIELRLQRACDLLSRSHLSRRKVSDIALACGFNDLSYFHRCFRRRFGITPAGLKVR